MPAPKQKRGMRAKARGSGIGDNGDTGDESSDDSRPSDDSSYSDEDDDDDDDDDDAENDATTGVGVSGSSVCDDSASRRFGSSSVEQVMFTMHVM